MTAFMFFSTILMYKDYVILLLRCFDNFCFFIIFGTNAGPEREEASGGDNLDGAVRF